VRWGKRSIFWISVLLVLVAGGAGVWALLRSTTEERLVNQVDVPSSWDFQKQYQVQIVTTRAYLAPPEEVTVDGLEVPADFKRPPRDQENLEGFAGFRPVAVWLVDGCRVAVVRDVRPERQHIVWDDLSKEEKNALEEGDLVLGLVLAECAPLG
jgi:hypothetical protein